MRIQDKVCFALSVFFFVGNAAAGNEVGNGGDVVVCTDANEQIESLELLDFWEAQEESAVLFKKIPEDTSVESVLESVFSQLAPLAPSLARQYGLRSKEFFKEVRFVEASKLTELDDSLHALNPSTENCKIQQVAIRVKDDTAPKRFLVDKKLWEQMSSKQKAGLVLHEIVYEQLAFIEDTDSRRARRLVAFFFSQNFAKLSANDFWAQLRKWRLPIYRGRTMAR